MANPENRLRFDLSEELQAFRAREEQLRWEGTFADYFEKAVENPAIARLSHGRVYDMIASAGTQDSPESNKKTYQFFAGEVFGLESPLAQIVEYYRGAAKGLEVRKRILLLMGPVGGGKSTIVSLLKRGLEVYSRTDQGAVYAITGCPMYEEPLHLIPDDLRKGIEKDYGLHIEGELCPHCLSMVKEKYQSNTEDVPVERITFSEKERRGIGTFSPSDPKSQDITELTGSINLATIGEYGAESDPRAYRFDGELNIANRGLMEFVEMLKVDEKFLYSLLTLSQEQNIKTGRYAMIYADEAIVSHTNEHEFTDFVGNRKSEALQDRIIVVKVPYNLRVSDEVKIYEKLLKESNARGVHIEPHTLETAATFAVLSRLEESSQEGISRMKKLRLYNGQAVEGYKPEDIKKLQAEAEREGMDGISPRFVINRLSTAIAQSGRTSLNPIDVLLSCRMGLEQHASVTPQQRDELLDYIAKAREQYDDLAKKDVQRAFVYSFEDSAQKLVEDYLDNIEAFILKRKIKDPVTDEEREADERFMRSIEEQAGVTESGKKAFREEVLIYVSTLSRRGKPFGYRSHEQLRSGIEQKLFANVKSLIQDVGNSTAPDPDQQKKIDEVTKRLQDDYGYSPQGARHVLQYVGTHMSR